MSQGLSLRGLEGLRDQLAAVEAELAAKALGAALREAFKPVLATAKALAPKWSGALADSLVIAATRPTSGDLVVAAGIKIGSSKLSKQAAMAAAVFGEGQSAELPPARRWHWIELGTIKMAAHPFLRPALDANAQAVLDSLKELLRKKIEQALKRKGR